MRRTPEKLTYKEGRPTYREKCDNLEYKGIQRRIIFAAALKLGDFRLKYCDPLLWRERRREAPR